MDLGVRREDPRGRGAQLVSHVLAERRSRRPDEHDHEVAVFALEVASGEAVDRCVLLGQSVDQRPRRVVVVDLHEQRVLRAGDRIAQRVADLLERRAVGVQPLVGLEERAFGADVADHRVDELRPQRVELTREHVRRAAVGLAVGALDRDHHHQRAGQGVRDALELRGDRVIGAQELGQAALEREPGRQRARRHRDRDRDREHELGALPARGDDALDHLSSGRARARTRLRGIARSRS